MSGSNFNPQNTPCIPAVKIIAFLELEPRLNDKCGFNGAGKNEHFSKVSNLSPGCRHFSLDIPEN
jgi:hypothetical protein